MVVSVHVCVSVLIPLWSQWRTVKEISLIAQIINRRAEETRQREQENLLDKMEAEILNSNEWQAIREVNIKKPIERQDECENPIDFTAGV